MCWRPYLNPSKSPIGELKKTPKPTKNKLVDVSVAKKGQNTWKKQKTLLFDKFGPQMPEPKITKFPGIKVEEGE